MNPLTADEMACVASTVSGWQWEIYNNQVWHFHAYGRDQWLPAFDKGSYVQRSQALAVVEWLIKWILDNPIGRSAVNNRLLMVACCVQEKDITGLQRLVLELRNPQ